MNALRKVNEQHENIFNNNMLCKQSHQPSAPFCSALKLSYETTLMAGIERVNNYRMVRGNSLLLASLWKIEENN